MRPNRLRRRQRHRRPRVGVSKTMFKPATIQRIQNAMHFSQQVMGAQPSADKFSPGEFSRAVIALAALILEEDDRQARTIIIPGH
jgi:hypothetical protein